MLKITFENLASRQNTRQLLFVCFKEAYLRFRLMSNNENKNALKLHFAVFGHVNQPLFFNSNNMESLNGVNIKVIFAEYLLIFIGPSIAVNYFENKKMAGVLIFMTWWCLTDR